MLFFIASLLAVTNGQSTSECVYKLGGLTLDLYTVKGRALFYEELDYIWSYTICTDGLKCVHNNVSFYAMVEGNPAGINECTGWSSFNTSVQPFYDFAVASWIFNYSNGESCPDQNQQINRTTQIAYNCNPLAEEPIIVDVFVFDECNALVQLEWEGACVPPTPANEHCEFYSGFKFLNLSTIQGNVYSWTDRNDLVWQFSPCANAFNCTTAHGNHLQVMSEIEDPEGQCVKFLAVWSGDAIPFYDRTIFGQNYWDFFWIDGEECGEGGPLEVLNVRYYCNSTINGAEITRAYGYAPCAFRIDINTNLACDQQQDEEPKMNKMKQLNQKVQQAFKYGDKLDNIVI